MAAAETAGLLVLGLSERWRKEGLGPTRSAIAKAAPAPVLFVRRGSRPGLFAPKENVTQFKWSMAGGPGMLGLSPRSISGARSVSRAPAPAAPAESSDGPSPDEPPISVS